MEVRPASVHQHRFWVEWRRAPDADTYATAFAHHVRGPLDVDRLHAAVQAVADRHEGLRVTHHAGPDGRLALRLHERLAVPLHREQGPLDDVDGFVRRVRSLPFDLEHGAAVRLGVRSDGDAHLVVWVAHHVVFDGGAVRPFYDQVAEAWAALRAGRPVPERAVPRLWDVLDGLVEAGPRYDESVAWWVRRLRAGPFDVPVPGFPDSGVPAHHVPLDVPDEAALRALAGSLGATVFEALGATWLALLHRVTGQRDLAVSYPLRVVPRDTEVVASFVNNAVLRARIDPETSFARLVDDVHAERAACRPHQHAALADVVARLRREGALGPDEPLLTVGFAETSFLAVPWALDGLEVTPLPATPAEPVWDLAFEIEREPLRLRLCARGSRFPRWFAASLGAAWTRLVAAMLADPLAPIARADLSDAERLAAWNDTWTVRPRESVAVLWGDAARGSPDRVAVEDGALRLTYAALNRRAGGLARRLREVAGERAVVGLWGHPGAESVVGMVGIALAGCAVLPLRPEDPLDRVLGMLADAGAVAVVGAGPPTGLPVVEAGEGDPPPTTVGPDDPIAVMFTSGSTGRPKGAVVPHRGVVRLVRDTDWIDLSARDRILQSSDLAFDGATFDVWGALLNGATVVCSPKADLLEPARLAEVLRGVTITFLTTGLFHRHAAADPAMFRGLRALIVGGDVVDPGAVARVLAAGFAGRFLVAYGPTENTTYSTIAPVEAVGPGPLPIGRPIANTTAYVVDGAGARAPVGVPGELWLGGDGVALGYVGDPERTAERFVPNPWGTRDPVLYRTGDRARWRPDGSLDFLGRLDAQVKIRGFRVEPGEIDVRARSHPAVREAATVVVRPATALVCWFVGDVDPDDLRAWLAAGLPDYLVPAHVGRLDALPVNANGKVDRRALEARGLPTGPAREAATTPTERALAALWRDLLGVDAVSADDSFFRLGGDSLRAIDLVGRVRRDLGRDLAVDEVFRHARLADLAALIDARRPTALPEPVPSGRPPPATLPLSHFQVGQWFLMRRGMTYRTGIVLRIGAPLERAAIDAAWGALTTRHEVFVLDVDLGRPRMVRHGRPPAPVRHLPLGSDVAEAARQALEGAAGCELTAWTGPDATWLALAMPHVLVDGFGLEVLARELVDRLAGKGLSEPPLPLHDLLDWEAAVVTPAAIDAACAHYEARLVGDASVRVPRAVFGPRTTGTIGTLDPDAVARLAAFARRHDTTVESVLAYCAFLSVHLGFRTEFVRCLSAYNNRDLVALRTLPFMLANGLWQQSRLDPLASFADAAVAFARDRAETFRHARLPPAVFFATSLSLFAWGKVRHLPGTTWLGRRWARGRPDRSWRLAAYVLDLVVASTVYRVWRAWVARSGSATIRTTGCFVNVTTSLSEPPAIAGPWPVDVVRTPLDIPETVPGNPMIELYRDREGVRVLFQGLYAPGRTDAFVRLVEAVVRAAAADPDGTLGALRDRLGEEAAAFLGS